MARIGIDPAAYNAAVTPGKKIDDPQLKEALKSVTPGGENTLLHLAASVGNLQLVKDLLKLNPPLVKVTNAQGNTPLHLAAQAGFTDVVKALVGSNENVVNVLNERKETALFKAYESGDLATVKVITDQSSLRQKTVDERTCLHVAINRRDSRHVAINEEDSDLAAHILNMPIAKDLIQEKYRNGDTALHIAVARNDVDVIKRLIGIESQLCYSINDNKETPLCVGVQLGHLEAVEELIKWRPDAVEIAGRRGVNALHLAALVSQVRIVDYLNKKVGLLDLVNKGLDKPPEQKPEGTSGGNRDPVQEKDPKEKPLQSGDNTDQRRKKDPFSEMSEGDTPLHIAARKKNFNMVQSLLRIRGINKLAVNDEGLTALDIVKDNTQYHESNKIISVLSSYPPTRKPFLYSAPKVSAEKHDDAVKMVDKTFDDRRSTELVVAVLLATMSFTAAFTVPGSFVTDVKDGESAKNLGAPILLGLDSFKLFLIFDSVAFFLSLFVVLMWQMSTPITTGDKVLFLCVTNLLVCATFAFTAYGFMLAVYAMLTEKAPKLGWVVLGSCLFICTCANLTFFYMVAKFSVTKARFNYLNGLFPYVTDWIGESVWKILEKWGLLDPVRKCKRQCNEIFLKCKCLKKDSNQPKSRCHGSNNNV